MQVPIYISVLLWAAYVISLYFAVFWFLVMIEGDDRPKRKRVLNFPKVTVVVPAFNEQDSIVLTLESLSGLDYPRDMLEIIVVNDGSTDNTSRIVKNFIDSNRDLNMSLIDKENEGKGAALNYALKVATGEFFVCLDADSYVSSSALKKLIPYFSDESIAVVLPRLQVYKPSSLLERVQWFEYTINMFYKSLMSKLNCIHVAPGPFSVYRTGVIKKVGGFDPDNLTEDLEISLRLQDNDYKIVQVMDADVFTVAPGSLKELFKQRNRWYKGTMINVSKYKHMVMNRKYGDFGFIQMPMIILSGIIAIILVSSLTYFMTKPYIEAFYNYFFIDFDVYTLIKTFEPNFNILDLNYSEILAGIIMMVITITILKAAHNKVKEKFGDKGVGSLLLYMFIYFIFIGFVWVALVFDFIFKRRQKW